MAWIYILTNAHHGVLYVGMTSNIRRRLHEHRLGLIEGFTKRYRVTQLVYLEEHATAPLAIEREKQLKGGSRRKKEDLIRSVNPEWRDLYEEVMNS